MNQSLGIDLSSTLKTVESYGVLSSLCTIKQRGNPGGDIPVDALGQPDYTATPVAGLTNIPCMIAPMSYKPDESGVIRGQANYDILNMRRVILDGYFPQITTANVASIDGTDYEIMAVESTSQGIYTRLAVRTYTI